MEFAVWPRKTPNGNRKKGRFSLFSLFLLDFLLMERSQKIMTGIASYTGTVCFLIYIVYIRNIMILYIKKIPYAGVRTPLKI